MRMLVAAVALVLLSPAAAAPGAKAPASVEGTILGATLRTADLDRAGRFFTEGLGLVLARRIEFETGVEAIYLFPGTGRRPAILVYQAADDVRPVTHGDGFLRIVIAVRDAEALADRLRAAGYAPGPVEENPVNQMKTFWVSDPDGYRYEITQSAPPAP